MTKVKIAIGIFLLFSQVTANASESTDEYYFGAKLGFVYTGMKGFDGTLNRSYEYQDVSTVGIVGGYILDRNLIIEGDFTTNVSPGEIKTFSATPTSELTWNIRTISVHGVYKGNGVIHFRAKAGLTNVVINDPANFTGNSWFPKTNVTNFTYGFGMGFNTSSGKEVFIEWSLLSEKFSSINFGINF